MLQVMDKKYKIKYSNYNNVQNNIGEIIHLYYNLLINYKLVIGYAHIWIWH